MILDQQKTLSNIQKDLQKILDRQTMIENLINQLENKKPIQKLESSKDQYLKNSKISDLQKYIYEITGKEYNQNEINTFIERQFETREDFFEFIQSQSKENQLKQFAKIKINFNDKIKMVDSIISNQKDSSQSPQINPKIFEKQENFHISAFKGGMNFKKEKDIDLKKIKFDVSLNISQHKSKQKNKTLIPIDQKSLKQSFKKSLQRPEQKIKKFIKRLKSKSIKIPRKSKSIKNFTKNNPPLTNRMFQDFQQKQKSQKKKSSKRLFSQKKQIKTQIQISKSIKKSKKTPSFQIHKQPKFFQTMKSIKKGRHFSVKKMVKQTINNSPFNYEQTIHSQSIKRYQSVSKNPTKEILQTPREKSNISNANISANQFFEQSLRGSKEKMSEKETLKAIQQKRHYPQFDQSIFNNKLFYKQIKSIVFWMKKDLNQIISD